MSLLPYTVFDAEFDSGSKIGPKWIQDPILTNFRKIRFFARRRGGLTQLMADAHVVLPKGRLLMALLLAFAYFFARFDLLWIALSTLTACAFRSIATQV